MPELLQLPLQMGNDPIPIDVPEWRSNSAPDELVDGRKPRGNPRAADLLRLLFPKTFIQDINCCVEVHSHIVGMFRT